MANWNAEKGRFEYEPGEIEAQIQTARQRQAEREAAGEFEPVANAVRFDADSRKFTLDLTNGTTFIFPADLCQGLRGANDEALARVELTPGGYGLHWEALDADLGISGLLLGSFGGKAWMEALRREVNRAAGRARSEAKAAAVRENGKKGGRPRKRAL